MAEERQENLGFTEPGALPGETHIVRRRSPRRVLKGFLFLVVSGALLAVAVYSPLFSVRDVRIIGNHYMPADDIRRVAGVYPGVPLFQVKTAEMTQLLMKDLRVEQASVRRSLPSTLEIQIVERRPVATVDCDFGYVDLDREGTVIDAYKTLKKMAIPMVTGIKLKDIYIGDKTTDENLKAALTYLYTLKPETNSRISEVSLKNPSDVMAYTTGGVQIRLGALDRLEEKAHLTDSFIIDQEVTQRPVEYVDFKYTAPFIKFKQ